MLLKAREIVQVESAIVIAIRTWVARREPVQEKKKVRARERAILVAIRFETGPILERAHVNDRPWSDTGVWSRGIVTPARVAIRIHGHHLKSMQISIRVGTIEWEHWIRRGVDARGVRSQSKIIIGRADVVVQTIGIHHPRIQLHISNPGPGRRVILHA